MKLVEMGRFKLIDGDNEDEHEDEDVEEEEEKEEEGELGFFIGRQVMEK